MRAWAAAALLWAAGAVAFTWPLLPNLSTAVWGERFDAWTTMWLDWFLARAIARGELSAETDLIFFPVGYNLLSFGHAALQGVGALLQLAGAGVVTAYNLLVLIGFWATAMGGHVLGRRLGGSHAAGLLCGGIMAFNPILYGEMRAGCVELVLAAFFPLQAWLVLRLFDAPGPRRALAAGALLAITGPFNWYYSLFSGMLVVALGLWRLAADWRSAARPLAWLAAAVVLAVTADLPLIPLVRRETPDRPPIAAEDFTPEQWALSNRIANGSEPIALLDEATLVAHDSMQVVVNSTVLSDLVRGGFPKNPLESTPGALAWSFGFFGLVAAGRRGRGWASIALGFTVLTLGPFLLVDRSPPIPDWSLSRPLPYYYLYDHLPFFSKAYRPYRLGVVTVLALSALAALGAGRLDRRVRAVVAVGGFFAAAAAPHVAGTGPMDDARVPAIYAGLRDLPAGAVIELPLHYQPLSVATARFQTNQVVHGKPLLNCNQLIRRGELLQFRALLEGNRFLSTVLDLSRRPLPWSFGSDDLRELAARGFRYVVAHPGYPAREGPGEAADRLRQPAWDLLGEVLGEPVLADADTRVYALPGDLSAGREWTWDGAGFTDVRVPVAEMGLPVTLVAGRPLPLDVPRGSAARFSAWVLPEGDGGDVRIVAGEWSAPLPLAAGRWRWVEVEVPPLPDGVPWALSGDGARLWIDAAQVRR